MKKARDADSTQKTPAVQAVISLTSLNPICFSSRSIILEQGLCRVCTLLHLSHSGKNNVSALHALPCLTLLFITTKPGFGLPVSFLPLPLLGT